MLAYKTSNWKEITDWQYVSMYPVEMEDMDELTYRFIY